MNELELTTKQLISTLQVAAVQAALKEWLKLEESLQDAQVLLAHLHKLETHHAS